MARSKAPKLTPHQRQDIKQRRHAWLATLPTCKSCDRKILHEKGECVHCYMERLYGKA